MPTIQLQTQIQARPNVVFDLARSVDLHQVAAAQTNETAIAGTTSGLLDLGESVTWRAKHFGIYQQLTAQITAMDRPHHFADEMVRGAFSGFVHDHYFTPQHGGTLMRDVFAYRAPLGALGRLADRLFLERYMTRFLEARNRVLQSVAESEQWRAILPSTS